MNVQVHARRRFRRSKRGRWVAGICAGIARHWGWDVRLVRLVWLVGTVIPVLPGLPVYLLLWLLVRTE